MSQSVYLTTCRSLGTSYISAVYNGLTAETIAVKYSKLQPKDIKAICVALLVSRDNHAV